MEVVRDGLLLGREWGRGAGGSRGARGVDLAAVEAFVRSLGTIRIVVGTDTFGLQVQLYASV